MLCPPPPFTDLSRDSHLVEVHDTAFFLFSYLFDEAIYICV